MTKEGVVQDLRSHTRDGNVVLSDGGGATDAECKHLLGRVDAPEEPSLLILALCCLLVQHYAAVKTEGLAEV